MAARVAFVVIPAGSSLLVERAAPRVNSVIDIIYVLATIVFFALMIAYVAACDRLGRAADVEREGKGQP